MQLGLTRTVCKKNFSFYKKKRELLRTRVWRAARFRACRLKRKWYTICRSKKTRECVIGFIYRIDGIDWRPVNTFQFRPDFWHSCWVNKTYKCILALWLNNYFQVGNLKNWEVIRSISVLKNATIHFKFKIVCKHVVNQSCSWGIEVMRVGLEIKGLRLLDVIRLMNSFVGWWEWELRMLILKSPAIY